MRYNYLVSNMRNADHQSGKSRWVFYYDGECPFCIGSVKWLARMDLLNQIHWVPFQSLAEPPRGLTWEDLEAEVYLDTGGGRLYGGFYAVRMLSLRVLLLLPLAPLLWFPGMQLPGKAVYHWVSTNRHRISQWRAPGLGGGQS
jgi:predicted DCC family thiol-disulfide oxidoreductase YuxK